MLKLGSLNSESPIGDVSWNQLTSIKERVAVVECPFSVTFMCFDVIHPVKANSP
jgi:hypothetical protein